MSWVLRLAQRLRAAVPRRVVAAFHRRRGPELGLPAATAVWPSVDESKPDEHPERLAVLPFIRPRTIEIGCGHRKTANSVVGIDLTPKGDRGRVGNVTGRLSQADIVADGQHLPVASAAVDALIARHNLEHYVDTVAVLVEWRRVLRSGGSLVIVVPDEENYPPERGRTLDLDPTHYHGFSRIGLKRIVELVGGFEDIAVEAVIARWSFLLTARRA